MSTSTIFCSNPTCGEPHKENELAKKECKKCTQNSLKIDRFQLIEVLKEHNKNHVKIIRSLKGRKEGENDAAHFVKLIHLNKSSTESGSSVGNQSQLENGEYIQLKSDNDLKIPLRLIKHKKPENVPSIEAIYHNTSCIYVISHFVKGDNLRKRITGGKKDAVSILTILKEVAEALNRIHQKEIIHGDINLENIVFSEDKILFVDPVAAKDFNECHYFPKTKTAFIPPELWHAIDNSNYSSYGADLTKTHDIYSLCAVFVKVLSCHIQDDSHARDDDNIWDWPMKIPGAEDLVPLKKLLDDFVAKEDTFRKGHNLDEVITCLDESLEKLQYPPKEENPLWQLFAEMPLVKWFFDSYKKLSKNHQQQLKYLQYIVPPAIIFGALATWAIPNRSKIEEIFFNNNTNPITTPTNQAIGTSEESKEELLKSLEDLLVKDNPDYRKADILTQKLLFRLFKSEKIHSSSAINFRQDTIKTEEGKLIPIKVITKQNCLDLKKVDRLWKMSSDGKFGFEAQNKITNGLRFSQTPYTSDEKIKEDFFARQVNSLGWGVLRKEEFNEIEIIRANSLSYEQQRDMIMKIIMIHGGYSDLPNIKHGVKANNQSDIPRGFYPVTIKLGSTENWPNFDDWCSSNYRERRENGSSND
jgi:serine/threonine protein kinase